MELSIIIPCYNEVENVPKLQSDFFPVVKDLLMTPVSETITIRKVEVIFVDDGSRDGTLDALRTEFGHLNHPQITVHFLRHAVNQGLGAALRTGFEAATGSVIVTTDSDGTYRFSEIPALLACLTPDISIVTASPYHPAGGVANVPAYRLILSRGSSLIYRLLVDWHVHTYTALFRAYRREVFETVSYEANGFLGGTELLVKAMLSGFRVAEYPAVLHSRALGTSKAKLLRTILSHLRFERDILLLRLGRKSSPQRMQVIGDKQ
ncbi:MAG: glycosyltransferase family 2 protein [Caldilineaceae bacterium]